MKIDLSVKLNTRFRKGKVSYTLRNKCKQQLKDSHLLNSYTGYNWSILTDIVLDLRSK